MILLELLGLAVEAFAGAPIAEPLNGDDVWYSYQTQHDSAVRPSHAALDGTVWRADDPNAPTPPISYGCRCFLKMVAAPGSDAAKSLPVATSSPIPVADAFAIHLDKILPAWQTIAAAVAKLPLAERSQAAYIAVTAADAKLTASDARDVANMVSVIVNDGGVRV